MILSCTEAYNIERKTSFLISDSIKIHCLSIISSRKFKVSDTFHFTYDVFASTSSSKFFLANVVEEFESKQPLSHEDLLLDVFKLIKLRANKYLCLLHLNGQLKITSYHVVTLFNCIKPGLSSFLFEVSIRLYKARRIFLTACSWLISWILLAFAP